MHGNVFEWCRDSYHRVLLGGTDPEAKKASFRVIRGGGWFFTARYCRCAYRFRREPGFRHDSLGFRVAAVQVEPGGAKSSK